MKREDIIDALEYIDDEYLEEADQFRNKERSARDSEKITPIRKRPASVRRWGTLAASLAVLAVAAVVLTGILRTRSMDTNAVQSAEAVAEDSYSAQETGRTDAAAEEDAAGSMAETPAEYAAGGMTEASAKMEETAAEAAVDEPGMAEAEEYAAEEKAEMPAVQEAAGSAEQMEKTEEKTAAAVASVRIRVVSDAGEIVFALNDSPAAESLASQLPLTVDTEPYSNNEIIFHPETPLDTENGTEGGGTAGYLGYFAPWDNVVMYYGDFDAYPELYILGEAVSGAENIKDVKGRITIEIE